MKIGRNSLLAASMSQLLITRDSMSNLVIVETPELPFDQLRKTFAMDLERYNDKEFSLLTHTVDESTRWNHKLSNPIRDLAIAKRLQVLRHMPGKTRSLQLTPAPYVVSLASWPDLNNVLFPLKPTAFRSIYPNA